MNKIAIAFLAAMSLASFGCKKKGGAEAMDMMKKYKADLCACKDHDMACGKNATDAYSKATAEFAAKNPPDKADPGAKADPDMEKLTTEVADCSKRVMTPDMGAAGGAAGGAAAGTPPAGGAAAGGDTAAPAGGAAPAAGGDTAAPAGGAAPAAGTEGSGSAK